MVLIRRRDPAKNLARFYRIDVQWALDGVHLVREWGRIGSPGTVRVLVFDDIAAADAAANRLAEVKRRRGYR